MAVKWTPSQQQVIDARNRNLLVSAAAGSGKTAVLVERIIRMISQGPHPLNIDQLLVMTFTNAAAAEMRERVARAVDQLLEQQPDNEHLWLQAALVSQAQITTIDSFCLNLIRSHYTSLDIDPGFRIGDEGELVLMKADVMEEMLEDWYQQAEEDFLAFAEQFGGKKTDQGIEDVILKTWNFSQSHPWPKEWLESCRRELEENSLKELEQTSWLQFVFQDVALQMEELGLQLEEALKLCRDENGPLAYEEAISGDLAQVRQIGRAAGEKSWQKLYESLSTVSFQRLGAARSKEVDPEKKAAVSACRDRMKKAVGKCRETWAQETPEVMLEAMKATGPVIRVLLRLADDFACRYREKKRDKNILDFNDLEHLALEVLLAADQSGSRRPTEVALELSRQYEEILVDEYQDSNYVQEELIHSISREAQGTPNVFMVGDVKQSIYRFRLARPELFMEKYDRYSKEESDHQKIELHQNFRSRETVIDGVNHVFYRIMTKALGGLTYTEEAALHPGAAFPQDSQGEMAGELLLADTGADSLKGLDEETADYTARELEARMIAQRIKQITDPDTGLTIWDQGASRPARLEDVVILLRSLSGWAEVFVNVLMNEGIPAIAQTRTGYFNTVEVETVLSLLAVLDNPMQDIPLAAVMKSPIGGLTDEEMAWMTAVFRSCPVENQDRGIYGAWRFWLSGQGDRGQVPAEVGISLDEKLKALNQLLEELGREAQLTQVHQLLLKVYEYTGYDQYVSVMPGGETRRANLDMLVEKAVAYEATSYKGLFHFIRYIEKLKKYDTDFGEASGGESRQAVRIMSIHKSKGLEFPIVFLAGLGKRFNKQDVYSSILLDADLGAACDCLDLKLRLKTSTLKKQVLKRKLELEALGEELRILYVAMTRAKEKLILTGTDSRLEAKLEKYGQISLIQGQVPYTLLSTATSFLDWLLMCTGDDGFKRRIISPEELVGGEVKRQLLRRTAKEELFQSAEEFSADLLEASELTSRFSYCYPYQADTSVYAIHGVSELKKQGQTGQPEEEIGSGRQASVGGGAESGAALGTLYHRALERLALWEIHSLEQMKDSLAQLTQEGILTSEESAAISPQVLWTMAESPLGRRMAAAGAAGRLHREQQFMIGVPACEMTPGTSTDQVLVQGIIDAWLEEEDGLVLIDYKTDRVPCGEAGRELLKARYSRQLAWYRRALEQITGKPVRESILYSLSLQQDIRIAF